MKKPGKDKSGALGRKPMHGRVFSLLLAVLFLFFSVSCEKAGKASVNEDNPASENSPLPGVSAVNEKTPLAGGEMVLIRGNYWINGIPGFEVNRFSALTGDYYIRNAGAGVSGESGEFSVYLTGEILHFFGEWQSRPGTGEGLSVFQRTWEGGFLAAAMLDDGRGASWFAVFLFPAGLEGAGISGDGFNRMIRIWTSRVSYFLSLSKAQRDVSLPAVLEF